MVDGLSREREAGDVHRMWDVKFKFEFEFDSNESMLSITGPHGAEVRTGLLGRGSPIDRISYANATSWLSRLSPLLLTTEYSIT